VNGPAAAPDGGAGAASVPGMSREDLLARARALSPRLRERAARCIAERNIPAETIADYHDAGFLKLAQPRRYGGLEIPREGDARRKAGIQPQ
jgi:3-hydroxy-9,10-secoandrosta-1,3,5(10)-triene-9,17-dione monooxygenase